MWQYGAFSPPPECETGRIVSSGRPLPDPIYKGVQDLECFAPIDQGEYECQHDQDSTDSFYGPHTNSLRPVLCKLIASAPVHRLLSASFKGEASTLPNCQRRTGKSKSFVSAFSHELPTDSVCVIQTSSSHALLRIFELAEAFEGMPIAFTFRAVSDPGMVVQKERGRLCVTHATEHAPRI